MKTLLTAGLLFLGACASKPHQKLIVDTDSGLFQGESLLRVAGDVPDASGLKSCYQGDLSGFTERARLEFSKSAKNTQYWTWVGNCLSWHNELREARFFFGLALDLAKTKEEQALVKNNLAVLHLRQGRVSKAYDLLVEARALAPQFVTPAFNLAQLYVGQNLNQEALKILLQPPFEKSQNAEVLHLKGLAYLQASQLKEAGAFLAQIPARYHGREDVALTLAKWHLHEGRPREAQGLLKNYSSTGLSVPKTIAERLDREVDRQIAALEGK